MSFDFLGSQRVGAGLVTICLMTLPLYAGDLSSIGKDLLAARSQADFARIYRSIDHKFNGDTTKIVDFLRINGFSCATGDGYVRVSCVLAYCGDTRENRSIKELMSMTLLITERNVSTGVIHQQVACPETEALLKETQERLFRRK